ncbi:MAG TPA: transposase [Archangium sp.]|uniref:transposase n=1 Tax=Archangium sp. TaxID=1872627 RepID=UPI002E353E59|nr:transposase [Archangium sp.]HEX5749298.1 transposase [Archangium sp.]
MRKHKQGIVAYSETGLSNGVVEGLNNKIRLVIRRAYGFRNIAALKAMVFLCCGGLM